MSTSACWMTSSIGRRWTSTSYIERSIESGLNPWLMVRLPCGSRSTTSTFSPCSLNATARFSVVVVLATPPFWFANAMTRPTASSLESGLEECARRDGRGRSRAASAIEAHLSGQATKVLSAARAVSSRVSSAPRSASTAASARSFPRRLRAHPVLGLGEERAHLARSTAAGALVLLERSILLSRSRTRSLRPCDRRYRARTVTRL